MVALEMGLVLFEVLCMGYPAGPPNQPRSRQNCHPLFEDEEPVGLGSAGGMKSGLSDSP